MSLHIKLEGGGLPLVLRKAISASRSQRGWSQAELGKRVGLPQTHISSIETGTVVPRYDTLVNLVRVLGFDLLLVPRQIVPVVEAMSREELRPVSGRVMGDGEDQEEGPLYVPDEDDGELS
jgi:transcriptional regulator with XRE-family HTH domain